MLSGASKLCMTELCMTKVYPGPPAHPGPEQGDDGPYGDAGHGAGRQDAAGPVRPAGVGVHRPVILGEGPAALPLGRTLLILNSEMSVIWRMMMKKRNVGEMNFQQIFQ
jgi:hypothetical protein